jgi:hypothetical protein
LQDLEDCKKLLHAASHIWQCTLAVILYNISVCRPSRTWSTVDVGDLARTRQRANHNVNQL